MTKRSVKPSHIVVDYPWKPIAPEERERAAAALAYWYTRPARGRCEPHRFELCHGRITFALYDVIRARGWATHADADRAAADLPILADCADLSGMAECVSGTVGSTAGRAE